MLGIFPTYLVVHYITVYLNLAFRRTEESSSLSGHLLSFNLSFWRSRSSSQSTVCLLLRSITAGNGECGSFFTPRNFTEKVIQLSTGPFCNCQTRFRPAVSVLLIPLACSLARYHHLSDLCLGEHDFAATKANGQTVHDDFWSFQLQHNQSWRNCLLAAESPVSAKV